MPGVWQVGIWIIWISRIPNRSNIDLAAALRYFAGLTAFFFDISFDHLRDCARGEVSVLALFEKRANHNFRISARLDAHKPTVIFKFRFAFRAKPCLRGVADGLGAARLAREVDALQVRA